MRAQLITLSTALLMAAGLAAQPLTVSTGRLERHADFPSKRVPPRHVDVWLPDGYRPDQRYAVLYMHDGQMLFDSSGTWNHQEWGVDETLGRLMRNGSIEDCIVVAIWNAGVRRHAEYFPQSPFESLTKEERERIENAQRNGGHSVFSGIPVSSNDYLRFIVEELKPFIDDRYNTRREREGTFIAGSSMGGLISLYAVCEYPEVFGGAACLSTHWPGIFSMQDNPVPDAFFRYMDRKLPDPRTHRLYFDLGTATLDSLYPPLQRKADEVMRKKGYGPDKWETRTWPGQDHSERSWRGRLEVPMRFLLSASQ
jgi:enterochelin esterase-like enzyme